MCIVFMWMYSFLVLLVFVDLIHSKTFVESDSRYSLVAPSLPVCLFCGDDHWHVGGDVKLQCVLVRVTLAAVTLV